MSQYRRFERVHGGDAEKDVRFELLHDYLKAKRSDAEVGRQDAIERDDDRDKRAYEREIDTANRWLKDLFEDMETFSLKLTQEAAQKYAKWSSIAHTETAP